MTPHSPKKRAYPLLAFVCMTLIALTLTGLLGGYGLYASIFTHFKLHYALALTCCLSLWLPARRWGWAGVTGLAILLNLADITYLYQPPKHLQTSEETSELTIVSANVLYTNHETERLIDYVTSEDPDVLVLLELTPDYQRNLEPLLAQYPYQRLMPQKGPYGLLLVSRFPINESVIHHLCGPDVPTIHATLNVHGQPVEVIATHPPAPLMYGRTLRRNQQLRGLAELSKALSTPTMIIGDLNITSYHPLFKNLLRQSGLYDSRRGFGIQPTWLRQLGQFGIAIDHCLLSPDIVVNTRRVGPDIGSDHAPISLRVSIARK